MYREKNIIQEPNLIYFYSPPSLSRERFRMGGTNDIRYTRKEYK